MPREAGVSCFCFWGFMIRGGSLLTGGTGDLVDVVGNFAGADDGVDAAGLDDRAGHAPECVGGTCQGCKHR